MWNRCYKFSRWRAWMSSCFHPFIAIQQILFFLQHSSIQELSPTTHPPDAPTRCIPPGLLLSPPLPRPWWPAPPARRHSSSQGKSTTRTAATKFCRPLLGGVFLVAVRVASLVFVAAFNSNDCIHLALDRALIRHAPRAVGQAARRRGLHDIHRIPRAIQDTEQLHLLVLRRCDRCTERGRYGRVDWLRR